LPDQFQVDSQAWEGEDWWSRYVKTRIGLIGQLDNLNQEEEKMQPFKRKISRFKKLD
jgi:hypothetical protein